MPFNWAVKQAVEDSKESKDTHSPGCVASLNLLLFFLYLQGFLVELLYVNVGQKGGSLVANCLGMFPCSSNSLSLENDR